MSSRFRRAGGVPLAALIGLVAGVACQTPTQPSGTTFFLRLGVSPPAIQASLDGSRWTATWTINLDAATSFPPDSHGVLTGVAGESVLVVSVEAAVAGPEGEPLATLTSDAADIRNGNGGSNQVVPGGPLLQVPQQASYMTTAALPSTSDLEIVVTVRDLRGSVRRVTVHTTIQQAVCGGKGLPPC